jgi:hypothetical protein
MEKSTSQPHRPSRPSTPELHRIYSTHHLDDHSVYHQHVDDSESSSDTDGTGEEIVDEVRFGIRDERDVEASTAARLEKKKSTRSVKDPNLVTWDGLNDAENPKNWSIKKKWAATFVVSSFTFISPVSSSMVAPSLATMAKEFNVNNEVEMQLMLSVFVLAYAVSVKRKSQ